MSSTTLSSHSRSIISPNHTQQQQSVHLNYQQSQNNQISSRQELQKMKQQIELSKQQLISLVNRNEFGQKVYCFNNQAKKLIEKNKVQQALIYLNQAENILEYAASSGRNIQRKIIVEVLHNLACCYQILWDLEKCSNYIQALIFNFNSELKFGDFTTQSVPQSEIHMSGSKKSIANYSGIKGEIYSNKLQKQLQLSKYYLLYCAMNSQLKNNQGALIAAKKAFQLTKGMFGEIKLFFESAKQSSSNSSNQFIQNILPPFILSMLQQIIYTSNSIPINKIDQLFNLVRHSIKIYNSKCLFNNLSSSKNNFKQNLHENNGFNIKQTYQKYKQFSIGNIMQLHPISDTSYSQKVILKDQAISPNINLDKIVEIMVVFSICQFTMATELRYIALNKSKGERQNSRKLLEFKQSESYHLMSILLVALYMPFDILYMQHIISSYHTHYQKVLLSSGLEGTPQLTEDDIKRIKQNIVFIRNQNLLKNSGTKKQQDHKKCSTTNQSNQSLVVSFNDQQDAEQSRSTQKHQSKNNSSAKKRLNQNLLQDNNSHEHFNTVNDQNSFQDHNNLFEQYYYAKKNTEPSENLCYDNNTLTNKQNTKRNKSKSYQKIKNIASKAKLLKVPTEESLSRQKITSHKQQRKISRRKNGSKNKGDSVVIFDSKPSTIHTHIKSMNSQHSRQSQILSHHQSTNKHKTKSQMTPHLGFSPMNVPQIYSKINKNTNNCSKQTKQRKSKQNKVMKINIKKNQFDNLKHQSEYFNKCKDVNIQNRENDKKVIKVANDEAQNKIINGKKLKNSSKSRNNKQKLRSKQNDQIRIQYFHLHNPNIIEKNIATKQQKSIYTSPSNQIHKTQRKSQHKKQRLSSNSRSSLSKKNMLSPKTFAKKPSNIKQVKAVSQISKQKQNRSRMTMGDIKNIHQIKSKSRNKDSEIHRKSINSKKSQRNTYNYSNFFNGNQVNYLKTQQNNQNSNNLMKGSHFDRYYL